MTTESLTVDAGDLRLSARIARPQSTPSRGLIVALHGGTYDASYYDYSRHLLLQFKL